ncbi:HNH endonuclease family protein [Streptomyces synnematoformans]|uniref:HNH endonuclease family protein n=1 Tax=Streptomyces synnematoformans TaxID=415721 RepID=A0ABN2XDZ8_9ACTN
MRMILRGLVAAAAVTAVSFSVPASAAQAPAPEAVPVQAAIAALPVATEDRTGYDRDLFNHWIDEDRDSCDTRREVLIAEAVVAPEVGPRCRLTGGSWTSYYDEQVVTEARRLDIDHVVPLAEAWDSGASGWDAQRRERYANDLGSERSLVAVTARSNRQKADQDPSEWWVPAESATCQYLSDWVATKSRWGLAVDEAERDALVARAAECPGLVVEYEHAQ